MTAGLHTVTTDEADIRLDRWFRRHFPGLPQSAIQKFCRTGQIRVDGHRAEAATRLAPGQAVRVPPLPVAPPPAKARAPAAEIDPAIARDLQRLVIYRDDQVIVLNKPHGLPVQGGPGITHHLDGLLDALRFGAPDRPRLVHRLDRDTSGVLLLARTPGVAAKLAAAFRTRAVQKTYWAVVAGRPVPVEGRIDLPLKRITGGRGERTEPADRDDPDGDPRHHRLSHAGQRGTETRLAGAAAADRPHPPAARALRGAAGADRRRREICPARTRTTRSAPASPAWRRNCTCMPARSRCRIRPVAH